MSYELKTKKNFGGSYEIFSVAAGLRRELSRTL